MNTSFLFIWSSIQSFSFFPSLSSFLPSFAVFLTSFLLSFFHCLSFLFPSFSSFLHSLSFHRLPSFLSSFTLFISSFPPSFLWQSHRKKTSHQALLIQSNLCSITDTEDSWLINIMNFIYIYVKGERFLSLNSINTVNSV